jgi:multicomponent Na+:H+ antiporter subunit A
VLLGSLVLLGALAAAAPVIARWLGRDTGYVLSAGLGVVTLMVATRVPAVLRGETVVERYAWAPSLGVSMDLRLDALAVLFLSFVLVVGILVLAYTARYLHDDRGERLYALLTLFAASMTGLVLAADAIALFIFWEATSICSFLLIAGDGMKGRKPALRAFLVTAVGGLALFAGLILLRITTGSFEIAEMIAQGDAVRADAALPAIIVLVALGAFTKSAQMPFHFWLPGAMVAPTPVSTYLHAATMVKAGIYLLARFSPLFAGVPLWTVLLIGVGLTTALGSALLALKSDDLKALLAYSTISMLGLLVALIGTGTYAGLAAAGLLTFTHAAYKATLFMVAGVVDHEAGTRDIRELSGLRHTMPLTAGVAALAAASMAGLPPFLGFAGKEEAYSAFLGLPNVGPLVGGAVIAAVLLTAIATFGYSWRFLHGTFGGPVAGDVPRPARSFVAPPAVTALVGLGLGLVIAVLDPLVGGFAREATGMEGEVHLTLWHGLETPLALSVITVAAGYLLFIRRRPVESALLRVRSPLRSTVGFDRFYDGSIALGKRIGDPFIPDAPAPHLGWVIATVIGAGLVAGLSIRDTLTFGRHPDVAGDVVVAVLLVGALIGLAAARDRLAAVALLGVVGFLVAAFYVLAGAPDLALTQLLIETLTVVLVVLVFRKLPRRFLVTPPRQRRFAAGLAVVAGGVAALSALALTGKRVTSPAARYYMEAAPAEAGGRNVVNTILVDFRALDTLGEITVLAVAAIGIYVLTRLGRERDREGGRP